MKEAITSIRYRYVLQACKDIHVTVRWQNQCYCTDVQTFVCLPFWLTAWETMLDTSQYPAKKCFQQLDYCLGRLSVHWGWSASPPFQDGSL